MTSSLRRCLAVIIAALLLAAPVPVYPAGDSGAGESACQGEDNPAKACGSFGADEEQSQEPPGVGEEQGLESFGQDSSVFCSPNESSPLMEEAVLTCQAEDGFHSMLPGAGEDGEPDEAIESSPQEIRPVCEPGPVFGAGSIQIVCSGAETLPCPGDDCGKTDCNITGYNESFGFEQNDMPSTHQDGPSGRQEIKTAADLIAIMENIGGGSLGGHYYQTADICLSPYSEGAGWIPIGSGMLRFTGSYDGGGFKIMNLFIDAPQSSDVGLFGYVDGSGGEGAGVLQNINLTVDSISGSSYVGGLAGFARNSEIMACSVTPAHDGSMISAQSVCGGLIGHVTAGTAVESSSAAVGITTSGNYAGGLVGWSNASSIGNSYATGPVSGQYGVGGLIGYANNGSEIENCYAAGYVQGVSQAGGLVGHMLSSSLEGGYYDSETSGDSSSPYGHPATSEAMQIASTYVGWDFEHTWCLEEGVSYPLLRWELQSFDPGNGGGIDPGDDPGEEPSEDPGGGEQPGQNPGEDENPVENPADGKGPGCGQGSASSRNFSSGLRPGFFFPKGFSWTGQGLFMPTGIRALAGSALIEALLQEAKDIYMAWSDLPGPGQRAAFLEAARLLRLAQFFFSAFSTELAPGEQDAILDQFASLEPWVLQAELVLGKAALFSAGGQE